MESTLTLTSSNLSSFLPKQPQTRQPFWDTNLKPKQRNNFTIRASTNTNFKITPAPNPFISHLKTTAAAAVIFATVNLHRLPATACVLPPPPTLTQQLNEENDEEPNIFNENSQNQENSPLDQISQSQQNSTVTQQVDEESNTEEENSTLTKESQSQRGQSLRDSPLTQSLESNAEAVEGLKGLLQEKLEVGEDEEGLKILRKLSLAQPENNEWKFLMARLYNEMGKTKEARGVFEEILSRNPLLFEALFENALLMDRCGEGEGVMRRLEQALRVAEEEGKLKEARDVKLIIAQMQFLQKNVDEALRSYDELLREDPKDFRPYFCKGMIYSLLDKNQEAREQFAKSRELSPKKFEVDGYLRSPLSRMKLFGTEEEK
ncbi:hypothetical protein Leryth_027332 [Lithospermum erythrorhizon]|nr:hypothetical protein Leryth_027332 [Lithospermum erythrorhizon]